jgi:hypothetical protein
MNQTLEYQGNMGWWADPLQFSATELTTDDVSALSVRSNLWAGYKHCNVKIG